MKKPSKKKIGLSQKQITELEVAPAVAEKLKEQVDLARKLWGPVDGTPEKLQAKFARMDELIVALTAQRDAALTELNDIANLEMYVLRFDKTVKTIQQTAEACIAIGQTLRARIKKIKPV